MDKKKRENVGMYSVSAFASLVAVTALLANTLYGEFGGYGVGFALAALCLFVECFLFALADKIAQTRTKGQLLFSFLMVLGYAVFYIVSDLAGIAALSYTFDGLKYVRRLEPLGTAALVFEVLCIVYLVLSSIRMTANLLGKEFVRYESLLGTPYVRREQGEVANTEFPRKDTAGLFASADPSIMRNSIVVTDTSRKEILTPTASGSDVAPTTVDGYEQVEMKFEPAPETKETQAAASEEASFSTEEATAEQAVEIADSVRVPEGEDRAREYEAIFGERYNDGYAQDVRREYVPDYTVQKDDAEDDGIYTDFSYGNEDADS